MMAESQMPAPARIETRPMRIPRGVFVLRYASFSDGLGAPEVMVSIAEESVVEIVAAEPTRSVLLGRPGDSVVLRSVRESTVMIAIVPRGGGGRGAHITLERIASSAGDLAGPSAARETPGGTQPVPSLEVLAHVSRRGDVLACDEWIGGPALPLAIEGLELRWPGKGEGVDIEAAATVHGRERKILPPAASGSFIGTRGKASPLVGVSFRLTGPDAGAYGLICEALFLGAALTRKTGSFVELSGPTGREPLVGLRLSVSSNSPGAGMPAVPQRLADGTTAMRQLTQAPPIAAAETAPGRVRVLRTARPRPSLLLS